jgi:uncharacterized protein (DUF1800 family)
VTHPDHAGFFVRKLWSYFVPTTPDAATVSGLSALYRDGFAVRPVVRAILRHPALYTGPRMVKPPVVYTAGLLRSVGRGVDGLLWARLDDQSGQRLFYPPDVAGWDDTRWLDTATFRGRWFLAANALAPFRLDERSGAKAKPADLLRRATHLLGNPELTEKTRHALLSFAQAALQQANAAIVENALRQLVAVSPELMTA